MKKYAKFERQNSFHLMALRLVNKLPRKFRNNFNISQLEWKIELDEFLDTIPDKPIVTGLTPGLCNPLTTKPSNSLLHWIPWITMDRFSPT